MTYTADTMKEIVALCKRRGFIFAASDIYGGLNGFWDYGPLGVELKNNLRDAWWKAMVTCPPLGPDGQPLQIVGVDTSIIQNPKTWEASGHVGGFSDPMVDCKETKLRYRADHIIVYRSPDDARMLAFVEGTDKSDIEKRIKKSSKADVSTFTAVPLPSLPVSDYANILGPDAKEQGTLTEPKQFNLMFHTYVGATAGDENKAYLRPETAQGIFLNYANVVDSSRVKIPFGIAQVGKAFRNEVTPRNFIFRSREFEQMEMEWFCEGADAKLWRDFWVTERLNFWKSVGIDERMMILREHGRDELAHYAKDGEGTVDIEFEFPFTSPGFGELEGIAHRGDFDLNQHSQHSGARLDYFDQENNRRFVPHVIEPAAGLTRGVMALLASAYTPDPSRPSGVYMNFAPSMAPKKAAILPLTAKDGQPEIATKLYMELRNQYAIDLDIKQNIGKRYARQDEIGTPYCFTIDQQTSEDQTVTVRERNTMQQERVGLDQVSAYLAKGLARG